MQPLSNHPFHISPDGSAEWRSATQDDPDYGQLTPAPERSGPALLDELRRQRDIAQAACESLRVRNAKDREVFNASLEYLAREMRIAYNTAEKDRTLLHEQLADARSQITSLEEAREGDALTLRTAFPDAESLHDCLEAIALLKDQDEHLRRYAKEDHERILQLEADADEQAKLCGSYALACNSLRDQRDELRLAVSGLEETIDELECDIEDLKGDLFTKELSTRYAFEQTAQARRDVAELEASTAAHLQARRDLEEQAHGLQHTIDTLYALNREQQTRIFTLEEQNANQSRWLGEADYALAAAEETITTHWHDARDAQAEVYRLHGELAETAEDRNLWKRTAEHWYNRAQDESWGPIGPILP